MQKDIKLSNLKGLLIFLVIFGHLIEPYQTEFQALYLLIYSFHMPLFILVSGYFAKRATLKKVGNFALLYLIFQPLYRSVLTLLFPEEMFQLKFDVPYYHLWYLVSMALWYLIIIGIQKTPLRYVNRVVLGAGILIIGLTSKFFTEPVVEWFKNYDSNFYSYTLSYQRTLSFLPFFYLGYILSEEKMQQLYTSLKNKSHVLIMSVAGLYTYFKFTNFKSEVRILKGSFGIDQMKGILIHKSVQILLGYLIAILMCYILLNVVSNKGGILTRWGDRSLPIFLFHAFFVLLAKKLILIGKLNHMLLLSLLFLMSIGIAQFLSSDLFKRYTCYLWNPYAFIEDIKNKYKMSIND